MSIDSSCEANIVCDFISVYGASSNSVVGESNRDSKFILFSHSAKHIKEVGEG